MRTTTRNVLLLASALAPPLAPLCAQDSIDDAVEACLAAASASDHTALVDELLLREGAAPEHLLALLSRRPEPLAGNAKIVLSVGDQQVKVNVHAPTQRAEGQQFPVLLAINWSSPPLHDVVFDTIITADIDGYKPEQFSDEGRDLHMRALRTVAFRAGGDPDSLWFTGYSWGGHACYDDALHRPGVLRGVIARGGGPRRTWFRLLPNLSGVRVLAVCGGKDDQELVWNLREVKRGAADDGFTMDYWEPADSGHDQPLPGEHEAGLALLSTAPFAVLPQRGVLLADEIGVEHPLLVVDDVDARLCAVPERVPVSARASLDEQRRATIRAMAKSVASIAWDVRSANDVKTVTLKSKGVRRVRWLFRAPWFAPGERVRVMVGTRAVFEGQLELDARAMLLDAWRTGERLRPVLRVVEVKF
ncbi:MAG: hypothetical protein ABL997_11575 [Planctomycetota bacterium]